jgi:hypothetical protein
LPSGVGQRPGDQTPGRHIFYGRKKHFGETHDNSLNKAGKTVGSRQERAARRLEIMFGLDKLFGGGGAGIFGQFFDSIGLGWMGDAFSLAIDIATGNWLAAAQDVFSLVSEFSNDSWMDQIDSNQPLGPFSSNGCYGQQGLSEDRADELRTQAQSDDPGLVRNATRLIFLAHEMSYHNAIANRNLYNAQWSDPV